MKSILNALKDGVDARDIMLLVGLAMLGGGLWFVYQPAAFIIPGLILTYVAVDGGK